MAVSTTTTNLDEKKVANQGNAGDVQTPVTNPVTTVGTQSTDGYKSIQEQIYDPAKPFEEQHADHKEQVEEQQARISADPSLGTKMSNEEMLEYYADIMAETLSGQTGGKVWSKGGYTNDKAAADAAAAAGATVTETRDPATGEEGYYRYTGTRAEDPTNGGAGADYTLMTDEDYAAVQYEKARYAEAQANYQKALAAGNAEEAAQWKAVMDEANLNVERIRLRYGYQGGTDGSQYITAGELGIATQRGGPVQGIATDAMRAEAEARSGSGVSSSPANQLRTLLNEWKAAAIEQSNGKVDYAVQQAVLELERALADSEAQFKEQAEAVAKDEMQSLDNSALYAEARGDKGGIGHSQYNEIQAAAAQNRLAVQQAQTKLSTDTARQIADLRAQGEFEKADAMLEITQTYLSQLIELEQWAAEFGLSQQQFQASLDQWQAEYDLAMQQFQVDTDLAYKQLAMSGDEQLASMGEAMLSAGIMPSADQLAAMGMSESQATEYLTMLQLEAAAKKGSDTPAATKPTLTWAQTKAEIEDGNLNATVLAAYEYYMKEPYVLKGNDKVLNLESEAVKTAKRNIDNGIWTGETLLQAIEALMPLIGTKDEVISEEEALAILNYAGL